MSARLRLNHITKAYPGVLANDDISLAVEPGEVLALLGENGAGKSTLMKIISGAIHADAGSIEFNGNPVVIKNPAVARRLGIAMVHQHFAVFETLTVAENVRLGLPADFPVANLADRIRELGRRYGVPVDPNAPMIELSMGERQRVEIIRALMTEPKLLILDEPTSVLTPAAVIKLFETLKTLSAEGVSILFISHKLDEIRLLAHRCTVLRAGRVVKTVDPRKESEESLARLMIGEAPPGLHKNEGEAGAPLLSIEGVELPQEGHICGIHGVTLTVHAREIVGIAGISGNGQSRLLGLCAGELRASRGRIVVCGADATRKNAQGYRKLGLRFVPEQRLGHGAVPDMALTGNTLLTGDAFHSHGFIHDTPLGCFAEGVVERFRVATPDTDRIASALSGGNLQKYIVGREILNRPKVLLVDQPTWGVDVGAAAVIHNALLELRDAGSAILIVSEEIDELLSICDRIAVMYRGHISPALPKESLSVETIGRWMSGLWPESPFLTRPMTETEAA